MGKTVSVLAAQAEAQGVELTRTIPDSLPPVTADPARATWVLTNLVANALRYTGRGGHIRIGAEQLAGQVQVSVSDDGAGIPYELQARIFDKFVQVKQSGDVGGSGLGLAICREIIHAHGGAIWVESTPGAGSVFSFTLPAAGAGHET